MDSCNTLEAECDSRSQFSCPKAIHMELSVIGIELVWALGICDLLHQNESHVANAVFELADDKRQRGDIYHF